MTNAERDALAAALLAWRDKLLKRHWPKCSYAAWRDTVRRHDQFVYSSVVY